ncbi:hypothetical protein ACUXK4_003981 [Methylorubrum extorquens]
MNNAIERLRASKEMHIENLEADGIMSGKEWAAEVAEYRQLIAISEIDACVYPDSVAGDMLAKEIAIALDPEDEIGSRGIAEELFGKKRWPEAEWLFGWVRGAQAFFKEVKDEI